MAEQRVANSHTSDNYSVVTFSFESQDLRTITIDGEPHFVAKDVAEALGYARPDQAIAKHCKAVLTSPLDSGGQVRHMKIIPERDVYRLIMRSKLPAAEKFEEWVVGEVLPSIRKHGTYATPAMLEQMLADPTTMITALENLKEERAKRIEAEQQIEQDRPKVVFAESIEVAETTILIGELAKLIQQSTQYKVGQNRLFEWMRQNGYLHKGGSSRNMPTQRSMDLGLFEIKETTIARSSGTHIAKTTKVTGKGQIYFVKKFCGKMKSRRMAAGELTHIGDCCREAS